MDWFTCPIYPGIVPGEDVVTEYKKGDELTVVVLAVDAERERISLGLKQSTDDPFSSYVGENGKGSTVSGTIAEVTAKGATVELAANVEGYLRASEISRDHIEDARTALKVGDEIEAKITSIERKDRKISLSIKVRDMEIEDAAVQEYSRDANVSGATLGDKLKEQLDKQAS